MKKWDAALITKLQIKERFRFTPFVGLLILFLFSLLLPFTIPSLWLWIKKLATDWVMSTGRADSIILELTEHKEFIGTAVWTLATVLSTFVVFFFGQQAKHYYGVPFRRIIMLSVGSTPIPISVVMIFAMVGRMTWFFYKGGIYAFFYYALVSMALLIVVMWEFVYLTSDFHITRCIKAGEARWLIRTCKIGSSAQDNRGLKSPREYYYLIPSIVHGKEPDAERFEFLGDCLEECLRKREKIKNESELIYYLKDSFDQMAEWIDENGASPNLVYGVAQRLIQTFEETQDKITYGDKQEICFTTMIITSFLRGICFKKSFYNFWTRIEDIFGKTEEKQKKEEILIYLRSTLGFIQATSKRASEVVEGDLAKDAKKYFEKNNIQTVIMEKEDLMKAWIRFCNAEYTQHSKEVIDSAIQMIKTNPIPDLQLQKYINDRMKVMREE